MKIDNIEFENNIFLAPMSGITDIVFRRLCKEMGCGVVFTEMIIANGIIYRNRRTQEMLKVTEEEKPAGAQIFGDNPYMIAKVCESLNDNHNICLININMGCPVPKIVRKGKGAALMKNPKLASEIVKESKKVAEKPVTVKIRKGFDSKNVNAVDFAKEMEQAGADAIIIHGRTREQKYSEKADWDIIGKIKESIKIPLIGNGDIFTAEDAVRMFKTTGCDGVMVARGALGNPWIFREIRQVMNGEEVVYPTPQERLDMFIEHLKRTIPYYGERKTLLRMHKHLPYYTKKINNKPTAAGN